MNFEIQQLVLVLIVKNWNHTLVKYIFLTIRSLSLSLSLCNQLKNYNFLCYCSKWAIHIKLERNMKAKYKSFITHAAHKILNSVLSRITGRAKRALRTACMQLSRRTRMHPRPIALCNEIRIRSPAGPCFTRRVSHALFLLTVHVDVTTIPQRVAYRSETSRLLESFMRLRLYCRGRWTHKDRARTPNENIPSFNSVAVFNFYGRSMEILIAPLALAFLFNYSIC